MVNSTDAIDRLNKLGAKGPPTTVAFRRFVLAYFKKHGRDLPWRRTRDPYKILVSEVMLQQTQVERVVVKYHEFLHEFPNWRALSDATPADVVKVWMGLGYYRRAFNLHRAARSVCLEYGGKPPRTAEALRELPGVGDYTAAAVAAFAFGEPAPMIETNIRAVYLHVFFPGQADVSDRDVMEKISETMYAKDPRAWFYALMDLGAELKKRTKGINKRSRHHVRQSKFQGSQRQVRAAVLKLIVAKGRVHEMELRGGLSYDPEKVTKALDDLRAEGLIVFRKGGRIEIARAD